jgi:hypothetical protein
MENARGGFSLVRCFVPHKEMNMFPLGILHCSAALARFVMVVYK